VNRTIFVSKLELDLNEGKIFEMISQFGKIEDIKPLKDSFGSFKGCAFIKFLYRAEALEACMVFRTQIVDAKLEETLGWKVEWAQNKESFQSRTIENSSIFVG
jgi:RNA recognition motif-containing protein